MKNLSNAKNARQNQRNTYSNGSHWIIFVLFMCVFNVNLSTCLLLKFSSFDGLALARLCIFFFNG